MAANDKAAGRVASVMQENRLFPPPQEFSGRSRIGSMKAYQALYDEAANNPTSFWAERAQSLPWMKPYEEVLRWNTPHSARAAKRGRGLRAQRETPRLLLGADQAHG